MAKEHKDDEKVRFKRSIELATTIVIAVATLASAWCAYQATLWGGIQTFRLSAVNVLGRKSSEQTVRAGQMRMIDGILFIEYIKGKEYHNEFLAEFFYKRLRPEAKRATDAWLATNPFQNPQAPPHPFVMAEYSLEPEREAKRLSEESAQKLEEARQAGADFAIHAKENVPDYLRKNNNGRLADIVIVCTGATPAIQQAFHTVDRGGTILFFAPTEPNVATPMNLWDLWRNCNSVIMSYAGPPDDTARSIELIRAGRG